MKRHCGKWLPRRSGGGLGAFWLALAACSSGPEAGTRLGDTSTAGTWHGQAGSGGAQSAGGSKASGPVIGFAGSTSGGASWNAPGNGGACSAVSREGQRVPLDMHFLVDSSLSMDEQIPSGQSRWDAVSGALIEFLSGAGNADTAFGLTYFPVIPQATCQMGDPNCFCILTLCFPLSPALASCNVDDYGAPTVPLALPPAATPLISDLQAHRLNGGTPTRPALEGAIKYVSSWAAMHRDRKSVIVLATDGEPSGCTQNTPADVATVAANALASPAAIQTFVIGVGSSLQSLNLIAQAGGTRQAYLVEDANAAVAFAEALQQIRGVAAPCDFLIPTTGSQGKIDAKKVNVAFTPTGATMPTLIAQTSDGGVATCGPDGGWYYDNPSAPTTIKLCPTTCASLSVGSVQVEYGCETIVQPPR